MNPKKIFGVPENNWEFMMDVMTSYFTLWTFTKILGFEEAIMISVIVILMQLKNMRKDKASAKLSQQDKEFLIEIAKEMQKISKEQEA